MQVMPQQDSSTTGLIDLAFCKILGDNNTNWRAGDRQKFFSYATTKIHNMLIDAVWATNAH